MTPSTSTIVRTVLLSIVYCAVAYGTLALGRATGVSAVVWPANALAFGVLVALNRANGWTEIVGLAVANAVAHWLMADGLSHSVLAGVANGLSIGVTGALLSLWRVSRDQPTHVGSVLNLILISLLGPIPGSALGGLAIGAVLSPETPSFYYIGSWWLVEAVGFLLILPPFLFWRSPRHRKAAASPHHRPGITRARAVEMAVAIVALVGAAAVVPFTGMLWLIELSGAVLLWFALRFGMFYTAATTTLFALGVVACGLMGLWPAGASNGHHQADMLALQAMLALTTLPALLVAAIASQREKARRELYVNARRLSYALEGANDGLWDWDIAAGKGFFSHRASRMLGYDDAEEFGEAATWDNLIHEDDYGAARAMFDAHIKGQTEFYEAELRFRRKDGEWIWVHDRGKIVERDENGAPLRAVGTYTDISERKRLEGALEHLANHDALTGLANRAVFERELDRFAARLDRQGGRLATLLIDVDHFKQVNDTYGHAAGDALLVAVADRLRKGVRLGDVAARLGGDEFAVISIGQSAAEFDALAERLSVELAAPVPYGDGQITASVSIGVAVAASSAQAGDDLVVRADRALYAAKRDGRGVWRFFGVAGKVA
ncbi:diguanylate cyclase domain-containing protein [Hansschlegelia quercus]|uniref:Diguanylate cyclase n=1 Tax=Hansschlegelia quercus TaxID=2528245 RepID=A0A4Q9GAK0_9HYPH|nr:diguanylate cyclase [Hansschlegelia quercus]TBN47944.1 diguanylate cyclase [Hansschlegelia quercus]